MRNATRAGFGPIAAPLAALVLPWLGLSALLFVGFGSPEAKLRRIFGDRARPDAFRRLDGSLVVAWAVGAALAVVAIGAARRRRADVLAILAIGPLLCAILNGFGQDWSDPNWIVITGVSTIGGLASAIVGAGYWAARPTPAPSPRPADPGGPAAVPTGGDDRGPGAEA